jgi:hypothetical protein
MAEISKYQRAYAALFRDDILDFFSSHPVHGQLFENAESKLTGTQHHQITGWQNFNSGLGSFLKKFRVFRSWVKNNSFWFKAN